MKNTKRYKIDIPLDEKKMKENIVELSQEDVAFFKEYGYLLLKNFFTEEKILRSPIIPVILLQQQLSRNNPLL